MKTLPDSPDVAVIGAGPVGCVTALAFASQGTKVLLLEAQSKQCKPLAGEWLHPPAVEILKRLEIDLASEPFQYTMGQGFVVFPEDGSEPIKLNYPDGGMGFSFEHSQLISTLRQATASHPCIHLSIGAKVINIEGQQITFENLQSRDTKTIAVERIVGADGRASVARKSLGIPNECTLISYMAGVQLEDVELPFERFGHVLLGGPGPVLIYRTKPSQIRICLDVPIHAHKGIDYLWDAYSRVIPKVLLPAFQQALQNRSVVWVANQFNPRTHYGRPGLALVGDATGHFHPMTAAGMTMGFVDGECLVSSQSFKNYRRERKFRTYVPEMLATTLHQVFSRDDESAMAIRRAIYWMWRQNPTYRTNTMHLLSGARTNLLFFSGSFLMGVAVAVASVIRENLHINHWRHGTQVLRAIGQWLQSPAKLAMSRFRQN